MGTGLKCGFKTINASEANNVMNTEMRHMYIGTNIHTERQVGWLK